MPERSLEVVWLDAPCSGTGVMSRHPDARWRLTQRRLEALVGLQAELLEGVQGTVRPGGWLIYSTCSLEPEENGAQVDAFLARHPAFQRDRDDLLVLPTETESDGGFVAVLRRR
jgi:16S rRNA (cytosine967-C5)-methyltransferase